jgi:thiamine-phosphate pyrophosphorylase
MKRNIPKIQYITQDHPTLTHSEQAKLAFEKGMEAVQIRMKDSNRDDILHEAKLAMKYANEFNACLIINDSIEIAKEVGAHAVHLGLQDMSIDKARQIIGNDTILGGTANTVKEILLQKSRGADYVGLGPYRHTTTKKNLSPIIGLEGYKTIISQLMEKNIDIPLVAVGGIQLDEIDRLINEGLYGVAISGSLLKTLNNQNND